MLSHRPGSRTAASSFFFVLALLLTALFLAAPAAMADVEPNDDIVHAEGPVLTSNADIDGQLSVPLDWDEYYFYAQSYTQLTVTLTVPTGQCMLGYMTDGNGGEMENTSLATNSSGVSSFSLTTPSVVTRMHLRLMHCPGKPGTSYKFRLDTNQPLVSGPPAVAAGPVIDIPEPNELPAGAWGPAVGGQWYNFSTETSNDQDWAYFYTALGSPVVDVSFVTSLVGDALCAIFSVELRKDGKVIASMTPPAGEISHFQLTLVPNSRYEFGLTKGCTPNPSTYKLQWRVDPAASLVPALFVPPPPGNTTPVITTKPSTTYACRKAKELTRRVQRRLNTARRTARTARTARGYRRAVLQVRRETRSLKRARTHQRHVC